MNAQQLNSMKVVNVEHDLSSGFFWVEFEGGKSLQCCLKVQHQDEQDLFENGPVFLEMVELDNNGYNEGICWDVNEWASDEDGEHEHINDFLIEQARRAGLEIIA